MKALKWKPLMQYNRVVSIRCSIQWGCHFTVDSSGVDECCLQKHTNCVEISQLLLWTWNDERFSFSTTLVDNNLSDISTRCSSPPQYEWRMCGGPQYVATSCHYQFNLRCSRVGVACMGSIPKLPVRDYPTIGYVVATIAIEVWALLCRLYAELTP